MDKSITLQCWLQQLSSHWLWGYPGIFADLLEGIFLICLPILAFVDLKESHLGTSRRMSEQNISTNARFRVRRMQGNLCRKLLQTCRIWIQYVDSKTKSWLVLVWKCVENPAQIMLCPCRDKDWKLFYLKVKFFAICLNYFYLGKAQTGQQ